MCVLLHRSILELFFTVVLFFLFPDTGCILRFLLSQTPLVSLVYFSLGVQVFFISCLCPCRFVLYFIFTVLSPIQMSTVLLHEAVITFVGLQFSGQTSRLFPYFLQSLHLVFHLHCLIPCPICRHVIHLFIAGCVVLLVGLLLPSFLGVVGDAAVFTAVLYLFLFLVFLKLAAF